MKNELMEDARDFYRHGWLMGTSGNLSARLAPDRFVITRSGADKGRLGPDDFTECGLDGQRIDAASPKPSAETGVHAAIYRSDPGIGAIYHVHHVPAALLAQEPHDSFCGVEMIKGLGIWTENATAIVPTVENFADLEVLEREIETVLQRYRQRSDGEVVSAVNIRRHGFYAWGKTTFDAKRHVESLAYLYEYQWRERCLR